MSGGQKNWFFKYQKKQIVCDEKIADDPKYFYEDYNETGKEIS